MVRRRAAPMYIPLFQAFVVASVVVVVNAFYLEPEKVAVAIDVAREALTRAGNWAEESYEVLKQEKDDVAVGAGLALTDCVKLYEDSERRIMKPAAVGSEDALTWLSAALTSHQTCTEELQRRNMTVPPAVMTVASDRSVFYRCCFSGYQDTLFLHSLRHFYRDCQVHGTVDFIFGNAAAVLQNCDIFVRRPIAHQENMVTAQGRDDPNQNTGIAIHASRVRPAKDFEGAKWGFRSYLGRPWKRYSRTVFLKADLDGLVDPEGWARWDGDFALATLFYGEYKNTGEGAETARRVKWPGFHVLREDSEAAPFTVERFIQGQLWIAEAGVPFWPGLQYY